jgi:hypothetical protein
MSSDDSTLHTVGIYAKYACAVERPLCLGRIGPGDFSEIRDIAFTVNAIGLRAVQYGVLHLTILYLLGIFPSFTVDRENLSPVSLISLRKMQFAPNDFLCNNAVAGNMTGPPFSV